jgi:hypothetical protein
VTLLPTVERNLDLAKKLCWPFSTGIKVIKLIKVKKSREKLLKVRKGRKGGKYFAAVFCRLSNDQEKA